MEEVDGIDFYGVGKHVTLIPRSRRRGFGCLGKSGAKLRLQICLSLIDFPCLSIFTPVTINMSEEQSKASQDAEKEVTKLWRAWRTVQEMCADRVSHSLSHLRSLKPTDFLLFRATSSQRKKSASPLMSSGKNTPTLAVVLSTSSSST